MTEYTVRELMACWLSRDLMDGEYAGVGANFPVPRAAVLMAHFLHGPNMKIGMGTFKVNLNGVEQVSTINFVTEFTPVRWAESAAYFPLDLLGFHKMDVFFISGIQIDAFGNTNLIGIPKGNGGYKFRGPGSIGTTTLSAVAKRYYIVTENHSPRIFVEKCDIVSAMGYGDGTPGLRDKLKLPGKGPKYCITPLCVFEFSQDTNRMQLHSLHPGVTLDQVEENTGFEFEKPDDISETLPPSEQELDVLRNRVDPVGLLRK